MEQELDWHNMTDAELWLVLQQRAAREPMFRYRPLPDSPGQQGFVAATSKGEHGVYVLTGGNRCLAGETKVPTRNETMTIAEICESGQEIEVLAWDDQTGEVVYQKAMGWERKGPDNLWRVSTSTGQSFSSTLWHRVLTDSGWKPVVELRLGENIWGAGNVTSIKLERHDYHYDLYVPNYHCYLTECGIHHNSGKSETGAYVTARRCLFDLKLIEGQPRPVFWCIGKGYEECGEILWKEKLSRFIPQQSIAVATWHSRAQEWPKMIRLVNGVEIVFKSWEQERQAFQGKAIDGAWFDEQFPRDVFEEVQARCIDKASPIFVTLTPLEPDPFLEEKHTEPPKGWRWFNIDLEENRVSRGGYLQDEIVTAQLAEWKDLPTYEARKSGKFIGLQGAIYPTFSRQIHVRDFGPEDISTHYKRYCGIDFGYRNPFVCLWGAQDKDGRWWIYDEHQEAMATIEHHASIIARKNEEHGRKPSIYWSDPGGDTMPTGTGPDDYKVSGRRRLAEMGFTVANAHKDLMRGIEHIIGLMRVHNDGQPSLFISKSRCPKLIRQLMSYKWDQQRTKVRDPAEKPMKMDDHGPDAMRYMIYSSASTGAAGVEPIQTAYHNMPTPIGYASVRTPLAPERAIEVHKPIQEIGKVRVKPTRRKGTGSGFFGG